MPTVYPPPEIEPKTMYEYVEECGGDPNDDMMYTTLTIATKHSQIDTVTEYLQYALKTALGSVHMGTAVPGHGDIRPREFMRDVGLWLVRESFAFEHHFPSFANTMRLISRSCRECVDIENGTELYHTIYTLYSSVRT